MRSIGGCVALGQHNLPFVGAVNVPAAQCQLPTARYTPRGGEDVVVTVAFVKFGSLDGWVCAVTVIDERAFIQQGLASRAVVSGSAMNRKLERKIGLRHIKCSTEERV
jgi:hypothetical protein